MEDLEIAWKWSDPETLTKTIQEKGREKAIVSRTHSETKTQIVKVDDSESLKLVFLLDKP